MDTYSKYVRSELKLVCDFWLWWLFTTGGLGFRFTISFCFLLQINLAIRFQPVLLSYCFQHENATGKSFNFNTTLRFPSFTVNTSLLNLPYPIRLHFVVLSSSRMPVDNHRSSPFYNCNEIVASLPLNSTRFASAVLFILLRPLKDARVPPDGFLSRISNNSIWC